MKMKQHVVLFGFWGNPGMTQEGTGYEPKDGGVVQGCAGYEPKDGLFHKKYGLRIELPVKNIG
jgi:hypothetical protein